MKLISWNVNGIRSALGKGLPEFMTSEHPEILCLQETKAREEQVALPLEFGGYRSYWNSADKPGYSGVVVFTRDEPLSVRRGMGIDHHDKEGRVLTLEYPDFHLVNVYTPNAQDELRRLPYRMEWDEAFRLYLGGLAKTGKPVIFCGDLNVAHQEIDIARPKDNRKSAGFSDEERAGFGMLLESGFHDTFRHFYPDKKDAYSWWSMRGGARARNVGWRIDYFGVSPNGIGGVKSAEILPHITGSDHCPVTLTLG
ncbi:exodeoxyribonuclease III [Luteolibacter luteus]|uniref:Exodeoxyribonuclease III n=1 Tax=Luteolibacter luteus TaxID=2728835 RepID=A0A858RJY8_9BACT|nr:exodeoxyribonuclease III [Luteolibacter luteus]QJE97596.1 exodeoxyribonuclease III [Luteolibacter luteus]